MSLLKMQNYLQSLKHSGKLKKVALHITKHLEDVVNRLKSLG